jgi:broad specificity phosphatase PhoE
MNGVLGRAPAVDERLRPLELGRRPDGRMFSFEERGQNWSEGRDPAVDGGERMVDVGERLARFACDFKGSGAIAPVVAVSHSETIQAFVVFALKADAWTAWPPRIANGSVTVAECDAKGALKVLATGLSTK